MGNEAGVARSNPLTGEYSIVLPAGYKYGFLAQVKGYIPINENLDLRNVKTYETVNRDLKLVPMEVGQIIRLNNIFFEFGKYDLLEDSFSELKRVIKLMNENPGIKIEISGHTDDVGTPKSNLALSLNRAKSVSKFLADGGIDLDRLIVRGFGQSQPVAPNDTDENRQMNRRVEFKILDR
jgi:outer membrane protein OmpA-like peptidoglycan-associated protein